MSQPHPPIPEPQPHPQDSTESTAASAADLPAAPPTAPGPRTQSILVPPSRRPEHASAEQPAVVAPGEPYPTAQFAPVRDEPAPGQHAGVTDAPPPVSGPMTTPGPASEPHPETHPVSPPAAPQPSAADRAGAQLAGVRRAAGNRPGLLGLGLGVLALVLLQAGLVPDDGTRSLWDVVPTWSAFATLAVLVALVPSLVGLVGRGLPARTAWRVGAGGVAALGAFWVLVGLPLVVSDRGFWLTAALGAAGAALWLAPGRSE